ncbi:V-type proton ATPase 116 kDa subunit a 2-like, partial [Mustelus asterias]
YLENEVKKADLHLHVDESVDLSAPAPKDVLSIQEECEQLQRELREVSGNRDSLKKRLREMQQYRQVLRETQPFTSQGHSLGTPVRNRRLTDHEPLLDPTVTRSLESQLSFVAGIIHPWKVAAFERLLWRACCGYVIANFAEVPEAMEDPVTGEMLKPVAFLISYWGEQIGQKVKKICDCYHCQVFPYPSSLEEQLQTLESLQTRIEDLKSVLNETEEYLTQILQKVVRLLFPWMVRIQKMKAIYLVLNQCNFDITGKCMIAEVWCPSSDLLHLQLALERGSQKTGATVPSFYNRVPTTQVPPTLNRTNHFTAGFQSIVDAYGVGNYQEVNPALYTIITFPFLFAVMFGDVGHGVIMSLFAAWMVINQNDPKLRKETNE